MFQFHNPQSGQTYSPADGFLSCRGAILAEGGSDRAPHFSPEELELLAEGALAKYPQLYGPSNKQVKSHAKVKIWRAIARSVRTKGVYERNSRHCRKRWEDLRRWTRLTCVHLLGRSTEQKKKVSRTMTPMMRRILAVAYPDLAEQLQAKEKEEAGTLRRPKEEVGQPSGETQEVPLESQVVASSTKGLSGADGEVAGWNVRSGTTTSSDEKREPFAAVPPPVTCAPVAATTTSFAFLSSARHQFPTRRYQTRVSHATYTPPPATMPSVLASQEALSVLKDLRAGQTASLGVLQELSRKLDRVVDLLEGLHSAQTAQYSSIPAAGTFQDTGTSPPYPHTIWSSNPSFR